MCLQFGFVIFLQKNIGTVVNSIDRCGADQRVDLSDLKKKSNRVIIEFLQAGSSTSHKYLHFKVKKNPYIKRFGKISQVNSSLHSY